MTIVTVDDTNTSRIKYVGDWEYFKTITNEYGTSAHSVWDNGATATFTFRGISVAVYITVRPGTGGTIAATFRIDSGEAVKVSKNPSSTTTYHYEIFNSGTLPLGDHTLVITERGDNYFRLDSITYDDGASLAQSSSSKAPATTSVAVTPPQSVQNTVLIKTATVLLTETRTDTTLIQQTTQPPSFVDGVAQSILTSSDSGGSHANLGPLTQSSHRSDNGASVSAVPLLLTTYIDGVRTVTHVQVQTTSSAGGLVDGVANTSTDSQAAAASVSSERQGISTGAIIGIVVGLLVILLGFILLLFRLRRRNSGNNSRHTQERPSMETSSQAASSVWPRRNTTTTLTPYNVSASSSGGFYSESAETRLVDEKNRADFGYPPDDVPSSHRSHSFRRDTFSSTTLSVTPVTVESHMSFSNVDQRQQGYPQGGPAYTDFSYLSSPPPPFGYTDTPPSLARVPSYRSTMDR